MKILGWLAAAVAMISFLIATSPLIYAIVSDDEGFTNAGWPLLFFTLPAAVPGYCLAALLAIVACGLAMARGAKRSGIIGIICLLSPPFLAVGAAFLPSDLCPWGSLFLPLGLFLAFLIFVAGLITTIVAIHAAPPTVA